MLVIKSLQIKVPEKFTVPSTSTLDTFTESEVITLSIATSNKLSEFTTVKFSAIVTVFVLVKLANCEFPETDKSLLTVVLPKCSEPVQSILFIIKVVSER